MHYYTCGLDSSLSVNDIVSRASAFSKVSKIAVIRSIDSTRDLKKIAQILNKNRINMHFVFDNICISISELGKLSASRMLSGFDEIWLLSGLPSYNMFTLPCITSDAIDFSTTLPTSFNWHDTADFLVGFGDGCGLNYITFRSEVDQILNNEFINPQ
jgi:hypothetical protein